MLHTITKRLEICIDINIEISEVDHYTSIFTPGIFRFALEINFLLNKYFFLQMEISTLFVIILIFIQIPNIMDNGQQFICTGIIVSYKLAVKRLVHGY